MAAQTVPAPTIEEITLADDPAAWERLGFAVSGDVCTLGSVRVRLAGPQGERGIIGWALREIGSIELDGLPTRLSVGTGEPEPARITHPNGVTGIDHVVAFSPDLDRSVTALRKAGLQLRRIREQPTPAGAPRQAFFRLGAEILELVQEPAEVVERSGSTDRPARFWGLALSAEDLEATAGAFGEHAGEIRPAVQSGRRILTVRRSAGLSVPLALMSAQGSRAGRQTASLDGGRR